MPNILVIMGDDIGWFNIGAYHRGIMSGKTPFRATKGTVFEGGFRLPCIARWPGHIKPGRVENGIFSGVDWFPTSLLLLAIPK